MLFPEPKRDLQKKKKKRLVWQVTGAVLEAVGRRNESKSPLVEARKHKALWAGLASRGCNEMEALPLPRLCVSNACGNPCEPGCSLLLWCCSEQRKTWETELMCPGRTNSCFLFGGYGKHLLSFPLNLDTIGEVFLECVAFLFRFLFGWRREGVQTC